MRLRVEGGGRLAGTLVVPGDKSISHRAAILASLAGTQSSIENYSPAEDCARTLEAVRLLGAVVEQDGSGIRIDGPGLGRFSEPEIEVFAGNSGTTVRLMAGAVASSPIEVVFTGDRSLSNRPMRRIIEPLRMMGVVLQGRGGEGHLPLRVRGGSLKSLRYEPGVASAQVKSSVLLAGLGAEGVTTVVEKAATRDHTERMMKKMGIRVTSLGLAVSVDPGRPEGTGLHIPGDFSSAAFLIAAAILCPGSDVTIKDVGLNRSRTEFLDVVREMGGDVTLDVEQEEWEPRGSVRARYSELGPVRIDAHGVARAIDEVALIALLATGARGTTEIRGAAELRKKESDRIAGTVATLRMMGADIDELEDGMVIRGPTSLRGATVSSTSDHRIAMMAAVAGLAAEGATVVEGWEWSSVSYPGFSSDLRKLGAGMEAVE